MKVWREPAWWILAAVILLFFWRPLTTETFCYRDLHLLFYPKKIFLVQALGSGQIPLWDPYTHGGQPYLASPSNTFYYPANLLYAILPTLQAFNTIIVLHILLCGWMAYLLSRVLSLSQAAALVSGVVYALCGYTLSTINLMLLTLALPWVPLTLAATHLFVTSRRARYLVVASLAAALPLLAGAAELTAMMFATVALWLAFIPSEIPFRQRGAALALVIFFAVGLSLTQTVPAAEMIRESSRFAPRTWDDFSRWSLSPRRLPEMIIPGFFGPTDVPDDTAYWGAKFEWRFPYILSIYAGVVATILALTAVLATKRGHPQRRVVFLFLALATTGVVFSLGANLPFFRYLYEYVPGVGNFRYPIKAMMLSLVPMALLAGFGVQRIEEGRLRVAIIAGAAASLVLLLFLALYGGMASFRGGLAANLFSATLSESSERILLGSLAHSAAFAALLTLVVLLAMVRQWRVAPAIVALVILDLAFAGSRVNFYAPRKIFETPPLAEAAQRIVRNGRVYREMAEVEKYQLPEPDPALVMWWEIQTLRSYTGILFGLPTILHIDWDGLAPLRITTLTSLAETTAWPTRLALVARSGVTAIITRTELAAPLIKTFTVRDSDGRPLNLYSNPIGEPVRFATRPRYVSGDNEAMAAVALTPFKSNEVILIGAGDPVPLAPDCRSRITPRVRSINESIVEVDSNCSGFVVFAETFYPGWKAYVDGRRQNLLRADFAFSAVSIPAGRHIVRKVYRPVTVPIGLAGSALALAGLIVVARRMKR